MPPDHHNSHPRSRGDSEPGPCFLFIAACSDGPLVPAGAHRLFSGPTYMRESDVAERNKKKATELSFSGAQTPGSLPQIHVQTAFCAPSRPFLSPSGHHGHTRPRSSPPTTSPACSRKQSSVVLHSGSVRCLRRAVRTREQRPAEAVKNRFGRKGIGTRTENRPPPTQAPCPKEKNRTGGKQAGAPHFAHAAIKNCPRNAHRRQQKCTFSQGQNPHLRPKERLLRWRVAFTLRFGAYRRTGSSHVFIERPHVNS